MEKASPSQPHDGEAGRLRRQQAALAGFGRHALTTEEIDVLLAEAVLLVSEALEVELVKVMELRRERGDMLMRAGTNWKPGVVGRATFGLDARSPGGYALMVGAPVISDDVSRERRFEIPPLLIEHDVKSMVNVVIRGARDWGVLEVDARQPRRFDDDDVAFLQNYAHLLAFAIERAEAGRRMAELAERRHILLGEMQHRVGNLLANIRALGRRTRAASPDLDAFAEAFDARLEALGRTFTLLSRDPAAGAVLGDLVRQELDAHGAREGRRLAVSGPAIELPAKVAQALAMAFHELATNASKHGALARPEGRLEVTWAMAPDPRQRGGEELTITWRERGVPIAHPPARRGFGSETIERSLPYMLGGTAVLAFCPDGLECTIRFPLRGPAPGAAGVP